MSNYGLKSAALYTCLAAMLLSSCAKKLVSIEYSPQYSVGKPCYMESFEIAKSIDYVLDEGHSEGKSHWQKPQETIARGKGDCDDSGILLYDLSKRCGADTRAVKGFGNIYKFESHFWIEYDEPNEGVLILDPSIGKIIRKRLVEKMDPRYLYIGIRDVTDSVEALLAE